MQAEKIKRATFKHIESELFNYHHTLRLLEQRRQEILYNSNQPDENVGGGRSNLPGDPTARKAIALVVDKRIEHLETIINAIDVVICMLPDEKMMFVKSRYWTNPQTLTWDGIAMKMNISRKTAFRWREEVILSIAERLGWF
jgi:RinA family phage transcriptional activator